MLGCNWVGVWFPEGEGEKEERGERREERREMKE